MFQQQPHYLQREVKTSQPRFTRLTRVNNSDSTPKTTFTQGFPSVNRGYALDNSKQNLYYQTHLTKVRSACRLDQTTIVSKYLGSIRKDYDEMSKASRRELNSVKLKKREIEFMRRKNEVWAESRQELQAKIAEKEQETSDVHGKEDDAKMQTKTLENIIVRMKKDEIFYKQYGRIKDEELKQKVKDLKFLDQNLIQEQEKLHKLSSVLGECRGLYGKNREVRQKKFDDFSGKISQVRQRDRFIQQRKDRTYQLQSIELNDTLDQKNIHMRQIILAHKVADSMLQSKVNSLIKRYSDIQGAFHLVKIKTGISEPQLLTSKFFSYEQTAETLLQTITENEQNIMALNQRKERLMAEYKSLSQQKLSISEGDPCWMQDCDQTNWRESMMRQTNRSQLLADQIVSWTSRHLRELRHEDCPKDASLAQRFELLCRALLHHVKKYQNMDFGEKKAETIGGVRMKKIVKEQSPEQLSMRLRETEDMNESNLVEEEFIKNSRQNIAKKGFNIKHYKRESKV